MIGTSINCSTILLESRVQETWLCLSSVKCSVVSPSLKGGIVRPASLPISCECRVETVLGDRAISVVGGIELIAMIVCYNITCLVERTAELVTRVEGGIVPLSFPIVRSVEEVLLLSFGTKVEAMI